MVLTSGILGLLVPFLIGKAVDAIFPGPNLVEFGRLKFISALLLSIYILDGIITFLQEYIVAGIAQKVVHDIRKTYLVNFNPCQ